MTHVPPRLRYTSGVSNLFVQRMVHNFEQALRLMDAALTDCRDELWQTDLWPDQAPTVRRRTVDCTPRRPGSSVITRR